MMAKKNMTDILKGCVRFNSVDACQKGLDQVAEYIEKSVPIDNNFGTILICAVRYALGRQTYMPSLVQDYIRPLLPRLNNNCLCVLDQDLKENRCWGDKVIDMPGWMKFWEEVQAEIKVRKERGAYNEL